MSNNKYDPRASDIPPSASSGHYLSGTLGTSSIFNPTPNPVPHVAPSPVVTLPAISQISFETAEFADNPEPRCPCVLLLDVSGSMAGQPISELNEGLRTFRNELQADSLAMKRVEIEIVTFGPVRSEVSFQSAASFTPPTLNAQGNTPMGEAILYGLDRVQQRKADYRGHGISYYRPWVFLITDGAPTDTWDQAAQAVRMGEAAKAFAFFAIGVRGANMEILRHISVRDPLALQGLKFRELFSWLSSSLRSVSRSTPGTNVPLESPKGWASV